MYGLVNQAIQGLVLDNYGEEMWDKIRNRAKVNEHAFLSTVGYDDQITFDLAVAASTELAIPVQEVLIAFGKYWVKDIAHKRYGAMMSSGGVTLEDFLMNLPNFHSRVMLVFPNITPPEFKTEKTTDQAFHLHYYSTRKGLTYFMVGLIAGLSEWYGKRTDIKIVAEKDQGSDHDVFEITMID